MIRSGGAHGTDAGASAERGLGARSHPGAGEWQNARALEAYESRGALVAGGTREEAQRQLLQAWSKDRHSTPNESLLILAYTREEVRELNRQAREILKGEGRLGPGQTVETTRGLREFAAGDRIMSCATRKS